MDYEKSWDRIAQLLTNSDRNVSLPLSNCFGSVLYILGAYDSDKPCYADDDEMEDFIEGCVEKEDYLSAVVFFTPDELMEHAGIWIGRNIMFHQSKPGRDYEFKFISEYSSENRFLSARFYSS